MFEATTTPAHLLLKGHLVGAGRREEKENVFFVEERNVNDISGSGINLADLSKKQLVLVHILFVFLMVY